MLSLSSRVTGLLTLAIGHCCKPVIPHCTRLMIMDSHRTFSNHLSGQIKSGQTSLLSAINGKFTKETECRSVLIISTALYCVTIVVSVVMIDVIYDDMREMILILMISTITATIEQ